MGYQKVCANLNFAQTFFMYPKPKEHKKREIHGCIPLFYLI